MSNVSTLTFKGCKCDWRPKCERFGPCGEYADTSEWMPDYKTGRWNPVWLCQDCLTRWRGRPKFIRGLDRPDNADESWRPSIMEVVRHACIALAFEDRRQAAQPVSTERRFSWERRLTAAQWDSLLSYKAAQAGLRSTR